MLLLFKGAPAAVTATIAGIGAVAAAGSTVSATIAGVGQLNAPTSIELMISATCAGVGGVVGISQGFLTRTASVDGAGNIAAFGGFGAVNLLAGIGGVTATVGSFFDGGAVTLAGVGAVIGAALHVIPATLIAGAGALSAVPIISGGTISAAASLDGLGTLTGAIPVQTALVRVDGQGGLSATGGVFNIPIPVESIRFEHQSRNIRFTHL